MGRVDCAPNIVEAAVLEVWPNPVLVVDSAEFMDEDEAGNKYKGVKLFLTPSKSSKW